MKKIFFTLAILSITAVCFGELFVINYIPNRHERFNNSSEFIGIGHNWSGVGINLKPTLETGTVDRWATLISPTYFISAKHHFPTPGMPIYFWPGNDRTQPPKVLVVDAQSWEFVETDSTPPGNVSDVKLGRFVIPEGQTEATLSQDNIGYYQIVPTTQYNYTNSQAFIVGRGNYNGADKGFRVGINKILSVHWFDAWGDRKYWSLYFNCWNNQVSDVATARMLDSGAPAMIVKNGALCLAGVHRFSDGDKVMASSFVPKFLNEICTIAIEGDCTGDQDVSSADMDLVRANWGMTGATLADGDLSGNGAVGSEDLDIVRINWGRKGPQQYQIYYGD